MNLIALCFRRLLPTGAPFFVINASFLKTLRTRHAPEGSIGSTAYRTDPVFLIPKTLSSVFQSGFLRAFRTEHFPGYGAVLCAMSTNAPFLKPLVIADAFLIFAQNSSPPSFGMRMRDVRCPTATL